MTNYHKTSKDFLIGAAVGSLLGTVSAFLIAPKAGKRLRQDICDMYCDLSDKTHDAACQVSKKSKCFIKNVGSQTCDWKERAKETVSDVKDWIHPEADDKSAYSLIGGVAGGLVMGALAGLLLAPKAGSELREDIADTYEDMTDKTQNLAHQFTKKGKKVVKNVESQASDWLDFAKDALDRFVGDAQSKTEEAIETGRHKIQSGADHVNNLMEWASLGLRVWEGIQKRR